MFGVGFQEMLLTGLLFLMLFGPKRLPQMARDLGSFANKAQHVMDELKTDVVSEVEDNRKPQGNLGTPEGREFRKNQENSLRS